MKKLFLLIIIIFTCIAVARANKAEPGWHTFIQSDGKVVTFQVIGDERSHATLTQDGLMLSTGNDGDLYYHSSLTGRTLVRAHDAEFRTAVETAFIEAQRTNIKYEYKNTSTRFTAPSRVGGSNAEDGCPAKGKRYLPVILVQFPNTSFKYTKEQIEESMLTGEKSVGKYFKDQSNDMYQPQFVVMGPYKLANDYPYYGEDDGHGNDIRVREMVREAIRLAVNAGDFKDYSTFEKAYGTVDNIRTFCDAVLVIYSGYANYNNDNQYDTNTVWPCSGNLINEEEDDYYLITDGIYGYKFGVFNELNHETSGINGIGTFCHEFSHCLGLPDFYDSTYGGRYGMGRWSLMDLGDHCDNYNTPVGYSAYEKKFMGWFDYTEALPGHYYTLPAWNQGGDKAVRVTSDVNSNEYFIYENRKKLKWDKFLPEEGIMVTHVSYDHDRWCGGTGYRPNDQDIQLMTIMPADGVLSDDTENGDLWPEGTRNSLTDDSSPATILYLEENGDITGNAGNLGKPVTDMVINNDGTAGFWFMRNENMDLTVNPAKVAFGHVKYGTTKTRTIHLNAIANYPEDNLQLMVIGPDASRFTVKRTVSVSSVCSEKGADIDITYTPPVFSPSITQQNAVLTIKLGDNILKSVDLTAMPTIFGDEDGDGKFNIDDVTSIINYLLANQDSPYSGELSIADLTTIIGYLLNGETTVDLEDGLVAYYPLDGDAKDMSGNGNHGIVTNVTATTGVTGKQSGAYRFGGTASPGYIRVPNSPSLQFNDGFTFSCFVKPMDWKGMNGTGSIVENGSHCIFAKSSDRTGPAMMFSGNDDGLHVWCGATGDQCQWANIGSSDLLNNGNYLNRWVHVAVSYSYSKRKARLYVNGNLIQEKFLMTPVDYSLMNASDLYLGRFKTTSWWNPMNGALDEVRIYNRALGVPEVKELAGQFITDAQVGLSESVVVMAVGEEVRVNIRNGSGNYSVGSCPDVVDCRLDGESIILTGMGEGTTNVTFIDLDSHIYIQLPVTVVNETKVYTVNGVSFTMVPVLGGTFTMGATSEQGTDAANNEKPAHLVTLSNYSIGLTEVTQALWQAVMGSNPSMFTGDLQRPVENVSWNDCQNFITKLNELTGQQFRLPTEAEWEYAARGDGASQSYKYSGGNKISEVAWWGCGYDETSTAGNSAYTTHPVGLKIANELSLYDMSGNVYEWCQDWYGSYSSAAQVNPTGPASGSNRVTRGGGWGYGDVNCRVSHRMSCSPTYRHPAIGLRLAQ